MCIRDSRNTALIFCTPHAEAAVKGTVLLLEVSPRSTRLEVKEGRAAFTRKSDRCTIEVPMGHWAEAAPDVELKATLNEKETVVLLDFEKSVPLKGKRVSAAAVSPRAARTGKGGLLVKMEGNGDGGGSARAEAALPYPINFSDVSKIGLWVKGRGETEAGISLQILTEDESLPDAFTDPCRVKVSGTWRCRVFDVVRYPKTWDEGKKAVKLFFYVAPGKGGGPFEIWIDDVFVVMKKE